MLVPEPLTPGTLAPMPSPATATGIGPHVVTFTLPANQVGNGSGDVDLTVTLNGCVETDHANFNILDTPEVIAFNQSYLRRR